MARLSVFDRKPPLSLLTAGELLDLAAEFRQMALTASTPEVRQSLDVLVVRYVVRAALRELIGQLPPVRLRRRNYRTGRYRTGWFSATAMRHDDLSPALQSTV